MPTVAKGYYFRVGLLGEPHSPKISLTIQRTVEPGPNSYGKEILCADGQWRAIPKDTKVFPEIWELKEENAQEIMDRLWIVGIRPTEKS